MKTNTSLKKFSKIILATATGLALSGNAMATHVNGVIKITNQTQCNIDLDQSTESSKGVIQLSNQTVKPKKTSSKITFQLDTGVYGSADVFANASCEAKGSGNAKYWTLLLAGKASGSFNTEADCKAAISGTVEGGQGILPGAFANLDAHGISKDGNRSGELNIFVSRKSASGIVISSALTTPEFCGSGKGFYRVKAPDVKPLAIKGFGEEITKGYFDEHTVIVEDASKDTAFINKVAKEKVKLTPQSGSGIYGQQATSVSYNEDGTFKVIVQASYGSPFPTIHYATVNVENFSKLGSLYLCVKQARDLIVYPTVEFPSSQSCK